MASFPWQEIIFFKKAVPKPVSEFLKNVRHISIVLLVKCFVYIFLFCLNKKQLIFNNSCDRQNFCSL